MSNLILILALPVILEPTKVVLPCYTECKIMLDPKTHAKNNVYLIKYKELNETVWGVTSALLFNNNLENLDVFKKTTSYTLRIFLWIKEESSYKEEFQMPELNFTTSCRDVHLENISLVTSNISADLKLNSGYEKEICNLDNYNLTVLIPNHEYNKRLKAFNRIEHLKPVTTYNYSITSQSYNLFTNFTTNEGSPEEVVNITWTSSDTSISLKWEQPRITNGKILGYIVSYQHYFYKYCTKIETDQKSSGKNTSTTTIILLENLNPNSIYNVWIHAFTKLPGKLSETEVSTKSRDDLDKDAYKISVSGYGTTIAMHFSPNCKKIKAPVKISVILSCTQWCNGTSKVTVDPLLVVYTLRDLLPFTEYHLKFILLNSAHSIELFTKTVTTESGIPGPVRYFEAYGKGHNSLLMRWKPAEPPTGIVEKYLFSAEYYNDGIWTVCTIKAGETHRCKYWSDMMCVQIKGVDNELRYRITITVKNKHVDILSNGVTTEIAALGAMGEKQSNLVYVCFLLLLLLLLPVGEKYFWRRDPIESDKSENETLTTLSDIESYSAPS